LWTCAAVRHCGRPAPRTGGPGPIAAQLDWHAERDHAGLESAALLGHLKEVPVVNEKGEPTGKVELVHDGEGGMVGYLLWRGKNNPSSHAALLGRVLPYQVNQKTEHTTKVVYETIEEARAALIAHRTDPDLLEKAMRRHGPRRSRCPCRSICRNRVACSDNPSSYAALLGRVLPYQVNQRTEHTTKVVYETIEEARAALIANRIDPDCAGAGDDAAMARAEAAAEAW
jgi:hypothetical protein